MGLGREMGWGMETADASWEGLTLLNTGVLTDTHTHTHQPTRKQYIRQFHSVHLADINIARQNVQCRQQVQSSQSIKSHSKRVIVN